MTKSDRMTRTFLRRVHRMYEGTIDRLPDGEAFNEGWLSAINAICMHGLQVIEESNALDAIGVLEGHDEEEAGHASAAEVGAGESGSDDGERAGGESG